MSFATMKEKKKIVVILLVCLALFALLLIRLFYIQIIKGEHYTEKAYEQQTKDRLVAPSRGTIYDATGKTKLALSVSTNSLNVAPTNIDDENKEKIAEDLAEIISMSKDDILSKLNKTVSLVTIKKDMDKEVATRVSSYISQNHIAGLYVDESTSRVYPSGSMLAHVLGFTGTDDQGLAGLEMMYDDELSGTPGKIVGSVDGGGNETPYESEEYIAPENGYNLTLTIDATIQGIVEKNLEKATIENEADYGICVVMRPSTGEVLAMAVAPDFDPNNPFTINDEEKKSKWDTYSSSEKGKYLNAMWRNKAISDTYEPGSTFKVVTAVAGLEEDIVDMDSKVFNCNGYMQIKGWKIRCWRYPRAHGAQSLRNGIMNSCNPVLMQLGQKIGIERYVEYMKGFNLYDKTGIDLPGEVAGIIHNPETMTELDLATTAFGQTIQTTALQTSVIFSAIANGGNVMQPYVVSKITTEDGSIVKEVQPTVKKQIMSKDTASQVLDALYDTVEIGTGKAARVSGYTVAGKTGTGEQGRGANLWYMASFAGIAPVNDPELVVIFNLYNPTGPQGHQGGTLCAPVVGNIIDESLRYLEVNPNYTVEESTVSEIVASDIVGKTYADAKKTVEEAGFKIASDISLKDTDIIKEQVPKAGASLTKGATIRVYLDTETKKETATVPDVRGKGVSKATSLLRNKGLNIRIIGRGNAIIQDPSPGETITKGSIVTVKFVDTTDIH